MAGETTTNAIVGGLQTTIDTILIPEVRENTIIVDFADFTELPQGQSAFSFQRVGTAPTLTAITSGVNEANAVTASVIDTTAVTVTPASKAAFVLQSWLSLRTAAVNFAVEVPRILGRAAADLMDVDAGAILGTFTNTVGTSGVDCTMSVLRQAVLTMRTQTLGAAMMGAAFLLHPQQVDDVDAELQSGTGAGLATVMTRADMVSWYGGQPGSGVLNNFRGGLMGLPVFTSANVPNANAGADHGGALFLPGMAIGGKYAWLPRIDQASGVSALKPANITAITCAYAFAKKKDQYGVSIITDHI